MKARTRLAILGTVLSAAALILSGAPAATAASDMTFTCESSDIPSGTYTSLTVAGPCGVEDGAVITVTGSVTVNTFAMLNTEDAASFTVGKNIAAMPYALLLLGDPAGPPAVSVRGNVTADDAVSLLITGAAITGNVTLTGGGNDLTGGAALPWAVTDSTIGGNLTVSGQVTAYLAIMNDRVGGNVTLTDITVLAEAQAVLVAGNTVGRNLSCTGLSGATNSLLSGPPAPNVVGGKATGQCAALL
jgi:hypothetical protein